MHPSLIADNYPIGIRARMSAVMNLGQQVLGNSQPAARRRRSPRSGTVGGTEGWRWAFFVLGIPGALVAVCAFFIKEPPRGQYEKDDVLGEVVEDENPAQPSMEAAFARLKKIATIRTSIAAFAALGFGLFALGSLQVAVPERHASTCTTSCTAASSSASRAGSRCRSSTPSARTSTAPTARIRPRRS